MRPLLLILLLVSACGFEPDALIFLTGVVLDDAGKPTPGKAVQLESGPRRGAQSDEPWRSVATATTNDDGQYTLAVSKGALYPGDGSRTTARAFINDENDIFFHATYDGELPPLEPWDAKFTINEGLATFVPAPLREDETTSMHALELVSGTEVLWREWFDDATTLSLPSVSSEDLPAPEWRVRAWRNGQRNYMPVSAFGTGIGWTARSASRSIAADVDRTLPISRGRPCLVDDRPFEGCPLTDGRMRSVSLPLDEQHRYPTRIAILLDAPHRVSSVVVRGMRIGDLIVEGVTTAGVTVKLGRAVVGVDMWQDKSFYDFLDNAPGERWLTVPVESEEHVERVIVRSTIEGEPALLSTVWEISVF